MKLKLLIGLILLLLIVGCNENNTKYTEVNDGRFILTESIQECNQICLSHQWKYDRITSTGFGNVICYCIDSDNAIWTFSI